MKNKLRKYRQDLHMIPELGFELYKTKEYILNELKNYKCEITEVVGTGVCAFFKSKGALNGETVAFRSDMDGLPVQEENLVSYVSTHEGNMHACGHDGHMAMLLGLAHELNSNIDNYPKNVLLIFQPAEETIGGANDICKSGILQKYSVKRIFGFHLWPMLEKNVIGSRSNEFMAQSCELDITINGLSAHCANAEEGIDALLIGCKFVNALYDMAENEIPENQFRLLKFGKMTSGTVRNAISSKTLLQGTLRCFNKKTGDYMALRIDGIAADLESEYKCSIIVNRNEGYPPVINDFALFDATKTQLSDFEFITFAKPFMQSEDFSFYQQEIPGVFLFLGTGTNTPLHSNTFDFDEDVLYTGVKAYLQLLKMD